MSGCTGTTTCANAPIGEYVAENVPLGPSVVSRVAVTFNKITNLNHVPYKFELTGFGGLKGDFIGAFEGSEFIPKAWADTDFLDIQWCPNQHYFQVTVAGQPGLYTLYKPSAFFYVWQIVQCSWPWGHYFCKTPKLVYG